MHQHQHQHLVESSLNYHQEREDAVDSAVAEEADMCIQA